MQFTQLISVYLSSGVEIPLVVEQETPGNIDIRIIDSSNGKLLGSKRFINTTKAEFDINPRIQDAFSFIPTTGGTGFKTDIGRSFKIQAVAFKSGDTSTSVNSRIYDISAGDGTGTSTKFQTTMPRQRLIPAGACDELSFFSLMYLPVTVSGSSRDTVIAESYRARYTGSQVFRLDTNDFPGCETITVDAGTCGTIVYTVIPDSQNAVRLAWRTHAGSIEHYSFPTVRSTTLRVAKQRSEGVDGHLVAAAETDREQCLVSAFESPEVLEAVAEAISSPQVWVCEGDTYTPVDVLTEEALIQQHGSLCSMELVIRPKNTNAWN